MEVALRRRLAGVAEISISQSQQTAVVTFRSGTRDFSVGEFRRAVAEADVEVIDFEADVCGVVTRDDFLRPTPETDSPLLRLQGNIPVRGTSGCLYGRLRGQELPYDLDVMAVADHD